MSDFFLSIFWAKSVGQGWSSSCSGCPTSLRSRECVMIWWAQDSMSSGNSSGVSDTRGNSCMNVASATLIRRGLTWNPLETNNRICSVVKVKQKSMKGRRFLGSFRLLFSLSLPNVSALCKYSNDFFSRCLFSSRKLRICIDAVRHAFFPLHI